LALVQVASGDCRTDPNVHDGRVAPQVLLGAVEDEIATAVVADDDERKVTACEGCLCEELLHVRYFSYPLDPDRRGWESLSKDRAAEEEVVVK